MKKLIYLINPSIKICKVLEVPTNGTVQLSSNGSCVSSAFLEMLVDYARANPTQTYDEIVQGLASAMGYTVEGIE
jgi:hypothetical protein